LLDIFADGIKLTLFANDWDILRSKRSLLKNNIFIADTDILCAMIVNALTLRAKFRDYYDLYVFNKNMFSINEIYEFALKYIPGMTKKIFFMQMTYIDNIEDENIDHLEPRYNVSLKMIQKHFENELQKIL